MLFLSCSDCCTERRGAGRWAGTSSPSHPTGPRAPWCRLPPSGTGMDHRSSALPKRVTAGQAVLGKERRSPLGEHPGSVSCPCGVPGMGPEWRSEGRSVKTGRGSLCWGCKAPAGPQQYSYIVVLRLLALHSASGGFGERGSVRWPQGASLAPKRLLPEEFSL